MTKYVLKRLVYMVIVFLLVSLLMYSIYNLIPTDPARAQLEPMKTTLKPEEYEQRYQMLRQQMGLDDPLIVRYLRWIGFWPDVNGELNGMLQGNFGYSQIYKTDVANVLPSRMLNTIYINIFSTLVALAITIPLGIYCAVHKRSKSDNAVQVLSIVGYSIPVYIIALIFIWLFAVTLRWLPVFGMQTPGNNFTGFRAFLDKVYYMTLPVLVMTVGSLGGMTRYVRAAMIEALSMDYIRTARAKGLREKVVVYSHAWRNALLPVITVLIGWFIITSVWYPPLSIIIGYWLGGAFLMDIKRFSEYRMIADKTTASLYRKSFAYYDERILLGAAFFYAMASSFFVGIFLIKYRIEFIVLMPFLMGLFCYYLMISYKKDSAAQAPEKLYREKGLMLYVLFLSVLFVVLLKFDIPALACFVSDRLIHIG